MRDCNILLVEDREEDALLFKRALERKPELNLVGHVKSASDAIAYLEGNGIYRDRKNYAFPDIMILDLKLSGRSGFEVLKWMRESPQRPRVGVFTISEDPADEKIAHELGADLFQAKTFKPEALDRFLHFLEMLACNDEPAFDQAPA